MEDTQIHAVNNIPNEDLELTGQHTLDQVISGVTNPQHMNQLEEGLTRLWITAIEDNTEPKLMAENLRQSGISSEKSQLLSDLWCKYFSGTELKSDINDDDSRRLIQVGWKLKSRIDPHEPKDNTLIGEMNFQVTSERSFSVDMNETKLALLFEKVQEIQEKLDSLQRLT